MYICYTLHCEMFKAAVLGHKKSTDSHDSEKSPWKFQGVRTPRPATSTLILYSVQLKWTKISMSSISASLHFYFHAFIFHQWLKCHVRQWSGHSTTSEYCLPAFYYHLAFHIFSFIYLFNYSFLQTKRVSQNQNYNTPNLNARTVHYTKLQLQA